MRQGDSTPRGLFADAARPYPGEYRKECTAGNLVQNVQSVLNDPHTSCIARPMTTPSEQFIEQMGLIAQTDGTPRIAGHILGYLIVEGEPRTLTQMTDALKISKASASTNARLLELRGAVRRVSPMGQRQDAYVAQDEPGLQTLQGMAQRFQANAETIDTIAETFPERDASACERVRKIAEFYRNSAAFLEEWFTRMAASPCQDARDTEKE
jgi:DNA-binding transcriptional regulator GbsR (MarR family)